VALVFKPTQSVSLYANYVQGLTKGPVAPTGTGLGNAGEVFPPYKSKQHELGVKGEWHGFGSSLSLFQISQPNSLTVDNRFTLDGEQRNRGVEWNFYGTPAKGVRVLGGAMLMNAKVTKAAGATQGKRAYSIPEAQFNLGGEWDVPGVNGLTLSGRVLRTGSVYIDSANLYSIPAWTRWDAGARYTTRIADKPVVLRANIENLLDKNYWMGSYYPNLVARAAPRTLLLSATMDF
jgi:iron complex outermembrane receptor protein